MSEKEIQFSIDAVGTIVHNDIPKILTHLGGLKKEIEAIDNLGRRQSLELKEIKSAVNDLDAKLEMVLGKLDLLEKRVATMPDYG